MSNLNRRLKKIENKLNIGNEQRVIEIVWFADGSPPPEHTEGNITTRYVRYSNICKKREQE
jgi:hypothetical protein